MSAEDTRTDEAILADDDPSVDPLGVLASAALANGQHVRPASSTGDAPPSHVQRNAADEVLVDTRPRRKVAIVGYTASRLEAPYDDPAWELWGMNNLHGHPDMVPRVEKFSRWYNLHDLSELLKPDEQGGDAKHLAWLQQPHQFPIFVMDPLDGVDVDLMGDPLPPLAERLGMPSAVAFPKALLLSQFMPYFTNTVSWQLAHVLWEAAKDESYMLSEIGLFGVDMAIGTEYAHQRPSVEFFLGLAQGLGVEITLPASSDLLKAADLYGGPDDKAGMRAKVTQRLVELHQQKEHIEAQIGQAQSIHASVCGAIDAFAYIEGVWLPPVASRNARDGVVVPAGAVSPVAQMIAEGTHKERHAEMEAQHG